ncbi:MAG: hypothetical protein ACRC6X_01815 [Culicoidibacterales bacterium]
MNKDVYGLSIYTKVAAWLQVGTLLVVPSLVMFVMSIFVFTKAKEVDQPRKGALFGIISSSIDIIIFIAAVVLYFSLIFGIVSSTANGVVNYTNEIEEQVAVALLQGLVSLIVLMIVGLAGFVFKIIAIVFYFKEATIIEGNSQNSEIVTQ